MESSTKTIRKFKFSIQLMLISALLILVVITLSLVNVAFDRPYFFKPDPVIYLDQEEDWHKIELGPFSISTPDDYIYIRQQGIDSYVGLIENKEHKIHFDYGWYSNNFENSDYYVSQDTINGFPARIALNSQDRIKGAHFSGVNGDNDLSIFMSNIDNLLARRIIKSIQFPTVNGKTTAVLGKNTDKRTFLGKNLFKNNCTHCHDLDWKVIGPPLKGVVSRTSKKWFVNWVLRPKEFILENEEAANLFEEYKNISHTTFQFSDDQIDQLIEYVEKTD